MTPPGRSVTLSNYTPLLVPADPHATVAVVEPDARWAIDEHAWGTADVVLWGRAPTRGVRPSSGAVRGALARELALAKVNRLANRSVLVRRLRPPVGQKGLLATAGRAWLMGGAVVEVARTPVLSILESAAKDAGVRIVARSLDLGSDGAAVTRSIRRDGSEAIFRVAADATRTDPTWAARALESLRDSPVAGLVPEPLGAARTPPTSWAVESLLPGRAPSRFSRRLWKQSLDFCGALPRGDSSPTGLEEDLADLSARAPEITPAVEPLRAACREALRAWPSILRHGDFWAGNLLVERGTLRGVIDWDTWHPSSPPGVDVLHLYTSAARPGAGRRLGEVFEATAWRSRDFMDATRSYWERLGLAPGSEQLDAVAVSWWAGLTARSLRRHPRLGRDETWRSSNVEAVLSTVADW